MGEIKQPQPVLLFTAVFSSEPDAFVWAKERAESKFGRIALESRMFQFNEFTDYYASAMGDILPKQLWAFEQLFDPAELPSIKRQTNDWEEEYKRSSGSPLERPLNLDPGYLDLGKFILASTKDHAHRIYLSDGIFAETTLLYTRKQWKALPWSYPDYQSAGYQQFLDECREYLKKQRCIV
ncbi:GTP-binding protein [Planctomycetales bacterium]|nr:GTP-binding protein [Planctomycetales bacterium]